jgi:MoxR-like ATPase
MAMPHSDGVSTTRTTAGTKARVAIPVTEVPEGRPIAGHGSVGRPAARLRHRRPARGRERSTVAQAAPSVEETFRDVFDALVAQVERVLLGKRRAVHLALVCLFAEGHLLIEDVPGVGKTSLAKALARATGGSWQRIQFTPDLLPSDVTGASIWNRNNSDFEFRPGPVFANVVLADEINRASPKTQSALLESMEERQVTIDGHTHRLSSPFMVIATQNPIELEGTYPLPEAQLDRFLMRLRIGYPDRDAELALLDSQGGDTDVAPEQLDQVADAATITAWSRRIARLHVAPEVRRYVVDIADATRHHRDLLLGASPRGALAIQRAARALAASIGRCDVVPDDVKTLVPIVLEHRIVLSPEAQMRGVEPSEVIRGVLDSVPIPGTRAI